MYNKKREIGGQGMKTLGKLAFILMMALLFTACSMNGQLRSSNDTHWKAYYQSMYEQVKQNSPEMDHVLAFCKEMIRFADQYEHNAISGEEFYSKQQEMRELLKKEDAYRRNIAWKKDHNAGPFEQYIASQR